MNRKRTHVDKLCGYPKINQKCQNLHLKTFQVPRADVCLMSSDESINRFRLPHINYLRIAGLRWGIQQHLFHERGKCRQHNGENNDAVDG